MSTSQNYSVRVLTVGVIVLLLLSIALYWGRFACRAALAFVTPHANWRARVEPCGLVPESLEVGPESGLASRAAAYSDWRRLVTDHFAVRHDDSDLFQYIPGEESICTYFDRSIGRIIQCKIYREKDMEGDDESLWIREPLLFVGPEGVSVADDESLGRFTEPLAEFDSKSTMVIFDKGPGLFFRADLAARRIIRGPVDAAGEMGGIVAIGRIGKRRGLLEMNWSPPLRPATEEERQSRPGDMVAGNMIPTVSLSRSPSEYILALDDTGRIYKVDRETLTFAGQAGYLPAAPEYRISKDEAARPRDLSAYRVEAIAFEPNGLYTGMFAATLSGDGTGVALAVFDADGEMIRRDLSMSSRVRRRAEKAGVLLDSEIIAEARTQKTIFEIAWGPALTGVRYALENLQPPVLGFASYFAASLIEADAGHRGLLILPHSFAGTLGRKYQGRLLQRLAILVLVILPSIMLSGLLAAAVRAEAQSIGFSERAARYWAAATVALGLSAYLTWRLTRPGETLVTCVNCGRRRRPDMEKCHHCGSTWEVAELTAPDWRVLDDQAVRPGGERIGSKSSIVEAGGQAADGIDENGNAQQDNVES